MAAAFDQPLFRDRASVGIFQRRPADAAAFDWPVEVASRERSLTLDRVEDPFAVDGIDCSVSQPMNDDLGVLNSVLRTFEHPIYSFNRVFGRRTPRSSEEGTRRGSSASVK